MNSVIRKLAKVLTILLLIKIIFRTIQISRKVRTLQHNLFYLIPVYSSKIQSFHKPLQPRSGTSWQTSATTNYSILTSQSGKFWMTTLTTERRFKINNLLLTNNFYFQGSVWNYCVSYTEYYEHIPLLTNTARANYSVFQDHNSEVGKMNYILNRAEER